MLARLLVASLLLPALAAATVDTPSQARESAQQQRNAQCQARFDANKTEIEALAAAGDSAGIKAIMSRAGCPASAVNLPARAQTKAANFKVECKTFQLHPLKIECTFSLRTIQKTNKR